MENSQLLELIGKTKTKNLVDDIHKEYRELIKKEFPNKENLIKTNALISVTDVGETEIKSIGMSCVKDLWLNNWQIAMSFLLAQNPSFTSLRQISNVGQNVFFISSGRCFNNIEISNQGQSVFLGSGSTPPVMDNFNIETALTSGAPESSIVPTGESSYSFGLGKVTIPTLISPTNGSGTIRESVLFGKWFQGGTNTIQTFALTRDLISPNVNYVATQSIDIEYSIVI